MWIEHLAIFVGSLALLVKSADWLVEFGARVARRLGVSDLVIGLTLTSVGTSVPELAASISASIQGTPGIIIGNVVGSNVANIGLIAGIAALVHPFATDSKMHERDGFILLAASVGFFALVLNNTVGRAEAIGMLLIYALYIAFVARSDKGGVDHRFRFFLDYVVSLDYVRPLTNRLRPGKAKAATDDPPVDAPPAETAEPPDEEHPKRTLVLELAAIVGSCAGVIVGARYLIQEATWAAELLGVPQSVIALSLISVGTSLPELLVAIAAARKGNAGMVIGNVMGSNLANILLTVGVSGTIRPIAVAEVSVVYTIPCMLFFTLALLYMVKSGWRVTRVQGGILLCGYAAFMTAAFVGGWS